MSPNSNRKLLFIAVGAFLYVGVLICLPLIGITTYPLSTYARSPVDSLAAHIVWNMRVPRVLLAYCAGAILSLGGMVFQSMFRNPLATPFTLGVSSGCSFGAALAFATVPQFIFFGVDSITLCSFLGGLLATYCVYLLTRTKQGFHSVFLLLAGVAVTLFFSSMVLFIQYVANFHETFLIFRWLVGGLETVSYKSILKLVPVTIGCPLIILLYSSELDLLVMGEEIAASKGVDVTKVKYILFLVVSFMISFIVALCGPIAFVGMIIPHTCRLLFGPGHKLLTCTSFFLGGLFLCMCDTIARTIITPAELPVGMITAFLGAPFFLWILLRFGKDHHGF